MITTRINNWFKAILMSIFTLILALFYIHSLNAAELISTVAKLTPKKSVAILQVVEHPALNATRQGIMDELNKANISTHYDSAQNNPSLAAMIAQKFVGSKPNILVGIGTSSTQALVSENRQATIPIIFSSVTDPVGARLISHLKKTNNSITGVSNFIELPKQFELFRKILPNLKKLGVIYNPGEPNSVILLKDMKKIGTAFNFEVIEAVANSSTEVPQATQRLIRQVDTIFINNDNTALSAFNAIIKIADQHKIPIFVSDVDMVPHGALAALGPNQYELGQQTAKLILQVLNGKLPENITVAFPEKVELHINLTVAEKLGIKIPKDLPHQAVSVKK